MKRAISLFTIFTVLILAGIKHVHADTFSLGVYPPLLEIMIMPGKSLNYTYLLSNSGDETEINTQIVPFKPSDELGNPNLQITHHLITDNFFSLGNSDITLGQPFILKQGENKQIILKVAVPENTPEKDYYYTLLFSTKPGSNLTQTGSKQAGILGSNLLVTISKDGKPPKEGEITEFKLLNCYIARLSDWCLVDSFDQPKPLIRIKNTGRSFWKPFGKISVKGWFGQKEEEDLRPDNILADSTRQIEVATPSAFPKSSFLLGKYTAEAEFTLDESETKLSKTITFFALPVKLTIALLTSVFILFTIKLIIRWKRRKT